MKRPRRSLTTQLREELPYLWRYPLMWVVYALPLSAYFGAMVAVLIIVGALVLWALWRTIAQTRFVGPLFYYDLVRLARRGRSTSARVLYVLGLLVVLVFLFYARFSDRGDFSTMLFEAGPSVSINEMSNMGEWFVANVIILQNLAVLLLTPAYVATAITEERERRTVELLFTSHLSDRDIIVSKFASRITHMTGVLLAGLPILSISQLLGGVDMWAMLANFASTAMNLWTVGSICILVSVWAPSGLRALLIAYGWLGAATFLLLAFSLSGHSTPLILWQQNFGEGNYEYLLLVLLGWLLVHLYLSEMCIRLAILRLRDIGEGQAAAAADRDYRRQVGAIEESDGAWEKSIRKTTALPTLPAVGERPLLWKEWHISGRPMPFADCMWGMMLLMWFPLMVFYGFLLIVAGTRQESDQIGIFRFLTTAVAGYSCIEIAYRTCISVVKERQRQTLDGLLTLPVSAVEILQAKWLGGVARGWGWIVYMAMILALAAAGGAIHWGAALLLMLAWTVHASFVASLGLFVSVVSRTVLIALLRMALALFLLLTLAGVTYELFGNHPDGFSWFVLNLCPPVCWYRLGTLSSLQDGLFDGMGLWLILLGLLAYGLAAWVLWLLARRCFGPV